MPAEAYANCRFYVEIDSDTEAVFTEVGGLQMETDVLTLEEGGQNEFVHRLPGRTKIGNITLKRGMSSSGDFFKWCAQIARGDIKRRNVSVVMYDTSGKVLSRWHFLNAYPVKWTGPQLTATSTAVAIESVELTHDGFQLE